MVRHVSAHSREFIFPYFEEGVNSTFANFEGREMGEEIIADEKNEEHPIINGTFEVEERDVGDIELYLKVFTKDGDVEEDKWFLYGRQLFRVMLICFFFGRASTLGGVMSFLTTRSACSRTHVLKEYIFSQDTEIWFVCSKRQHDKICIL